MVARGDRPRQRRAAAVAGRWCGERDERPYRASHRQRDRKLEALHAGTKVDGEREAARRAAERIRERLAEVRGREEDIE